MKAKVMKRAWVIAREAAVKFGGNASEYIAESLRLAWAKAKAPKAARIILAHQPRGGREWVARIVGRHPKFKFERQFIDASERDWSKSGATGYTVYTLTDGVYEINEPYRDRRFVEVRNGVITKIDAAEALGRIA